jgi:integrase
MGYLPAYWTPLDKRSFDMARRVRDSQLESRTARAKLKPSGKPYYRAIGEGLHLGYRKGATVGKWVVRRYIGERNYEVQTIATADDIEDSNGETILSFFQAQELARADQVRAGPYKVKDAAESYMRYLGTRGYDAKFRIQHHILPSLGDIPLSKLTPETIREWHQTLGRSLPLQPKRGGASSRRIVDIDNAESARKRKVSANRVLAILRAMLTRAWKDGKVSSDAAWRQVEMFKGVGRARVTWLTIADAQRLLNACDPEFRLIVRGGLETGCRWSELCRMVCGDFSADSGTIAVAVTKSGVPKQVILTDQGAEFFADLTVGRAVDAPMFGREWRSGHQKSRMQRACVAAGLKPIGFHQLRHTWASLSVMAGMPLMIVAKNLGHADTKMVEKHYGHLAPSYLVEQVRKFAPKFGDVTTNVQRIR